MPLGVISGFTGLVIFSSLNLVKGFLLTSVGFGLECWRGVVEENIFSNYEVVTY